MQRSVTSLTNNRKVELFDAAIAWVWEHTEMHGSKEYRTALKKIGYTEAEIAEEFESCNYAFHIR